MYTDAAIAPSCASIGRGVSRIVVHAVERIHEEEQPEAEERQEVTEDRTPRHRRDDEVDGGQCHRRREQTYRVVNPEPAERRALRARIEKGRDVSHRDMRAP